MVTTLMLDTTSVTVWEPLKKRFVTAGDSVVVSKPPQRPIKFRRNFVVFINHPRLANVPCAEAGVSLLFNSQSTPAMGVAASHPLRFTRPFLPIQQQSRPTADCSNFRPVGSPLAKLSAAPEASQPRLRQQVEELRGKMRAEAGCFRAKRDKRISITKLTRIFEEAHIRWPRSNVQSPSRMGGVRWVHRAYNFRGFENRSGPGHRL
jgi:hypothetical protein